MIVRTPRPGSPTIQPSVPSNSTSEEALDLLPSLSLRRCTRNGLRSPPGRTRGTRKQLSPSGAWASTRNASDCGAEQNHLCPRRAYMPAPASVPAPPTVTGSAVVVLARTSEPPCFSVMAMPNSTPDLVAGSRSSGSYTVDSSAVSHSAASSGLIRNDGTTACVIDSGQPCPASICETSMNPAARSTFAPSPGSAHADVCSPLDTEYSMIRW